ncbi:MAG: hypothetical protein AB1806_05075 [Acidobacteriota bacterium]
MGFKFDLRLFRDRIIVIDLDAGYEKMDCLGCGAMVGELFKNGELCWMCYRRWSARFTERWLEQRFGTRERRDGKGYG